MIIFNENHTQSTDYYKFHLKRLNTTAATLIGLFTLIGMGCGVGSYYERVVTQTWVISPNTYLR